MSHVMIYALCLFNTTLLWVTSWYMPLAYSVLRYFEPRHDIFLAYSVPRYYVPCHDMSLAYSVPLYFSGLGGSVGSAVRLETRRSRVQLPPRSATFFRGDWSWNIFYGYSLPSADSRRAVVSFWRKNVHNTGEPLRGLSLPSKRVVR